MCMLLVLRIEEKNTPNQIHQDASDLCGAVCRDTDALRENLNKRGYDSNLGIL